MEPTKICIELSMESLFYFFTLCALDCLSTLLFQLMLLVFIIGIMYIM